MERRDVFESVVVDNEPADILNTGVDDFEIRFVDDENKSTKKKTSRSSSAPKKSNVTVKRAPSAKRTMEGITRKPPTKKALQTITKAVAPIANDLVAPQSSTSEHIPTVQPPRISEKLADLRAELLDPDLHKPLEITHISDDDVLDHTQEALAGYIVTISATLKEIQSKRIAFEQKENSEAYDAKLKTLATLERSQKRLKEKIIEELETVKAHELQKVEELFVGEQATEDQPVNHIPYPHEVQYQQNVINVPEHATVLRTVIKRLFSKEILNFVKRDPRHKKTDK